MAGAHPNIFKMNLVNCTGGGCKDQQFENQFGQLHRWQAQRTRMQLDPTITLVNCTGGRQTRDPTINPLNSAGGRRGHPHFENQPGKLPGGRRSAETKDLTITLVNCTGGRRRVQGSDNQSLELHRWQAPAPSFSAINLINCKVAGAEVKSFDKQSRKLHGWQAQRPGI